MYEDENGTTVVNKIEALFERKNLGRFEKWRPAMVLQDRIFRIAWHHCCC